MQVDLKIEGLSCQHCVNAVEKIVNELNGVAKVKVALPNIASVNFDENLVKIEDIITAINNSEIYKAEKL